MAGKKQGGKPKGKKGKGGDGKDRPLAKTYGDRSKNYHKKRKAPLQRPDLGLVAEMSASADRSRKVVEHRARELGVFQPDLMTWELKRLIEREENRVKSEEELKEAKEAAKAKLGAPAQRPDWMVAT